MNIEKIKFLLTNDFLKKSKDCIMNVGFYDLKSYTLREFNTNILNILNDIEKNMSNQVSFIKIYNDYNNEFIMTIQQKHNGKIEVIF